MKIIHISQDQMQEPLRTQVKIAKKVSSFLTLMSTLSIFSLIITTIIFTDSTLSYDIKNSTYLFLKFATAFFMISEILISVFLEEKKDRIKKLRETTLRLKKITSKKLRETTLRLKKITSKKFLMEVKPKK